jgi:phage/plasmid-associated DNA primase
MPAILAWAVEGAMKYLASKETDPLGWCTAVHQASEMYRRSEDRIGMFLMEETEETPGANLVISSLYLRYRMWSDARGERPMTQIALLRKLRDRGIPIEGDGNRATLLNRGFIPTAAPSSSSVSIAQLAANHLWHN